MSLLNGILSSEVTRRRIGDRTVAVVEYPKDFVNEYCIFELVNGVYDGLAQLFDDGILRMSWRMEKGVPKGKVFVYDAGCVVGVSFWKYLDGKEFRWIENGSAKRLLVIVNTETNQLAYRGDYNEELQREGYGVEYENGVISFCGEWHKDLLIHLHQRVLDEYVMIEYGGLNEERNIDVLHHQPVYRGGYEYSEEENQLKRHGFGRIYDLRSGICIAESEWNKGAEEVDKRIELNNGWYSHGESEESAREIVNGEHVAVYEALKVVGIEDIKSDSDHQTVVNNENPQAVANQIDEARSEKKGTEEHYQTRIEETQVLSKSMDSIDPILSAPSSPVSTISSAIGEESFIVSTTEEPQRSVSEGVQDTATVPVTESEDDESEEKESIISFSDDQSTDMSLDLEELIITSKSYNEATFTIIRIQHLPNLRRIDIGDECFQSTTIITIEGLKELESIVIGSDTASNIHEVSILSWQIRMNSI